MKRGFTAHGAFGRRVRAPAWVDRWVWHKGRWQLLLLRRERRAWVEAIAPPERFIRARLFEPSTPAIKIMGTENRPLHIQDLSRMSPLLNPRELLGPMLPGATVGGHAIYAADSEQGRIFIPALLLIESLWFLSPDAVRALLTPNSLDVFISIPRVVKDQRTIAVGSEVIANPPSETVLRRLAWLAERADARFSWGSVLTNAYRNRLDLTLPKAELSGWVWGVRLPSGLLACELQSVDIRCSPSISLSRIRVGNTWHDFPRSQMRRESIEVEKRERLGTPAEVSLCAA